MDKSNQKDFKFKLFFLSSILLSVLGLNYTFGLGNTNPIEKGLLIVSAIFLFSTSQAYFKQGFNGFCLITFSIFIFGFLTPFYQFTWDRLMSAYLALIALLLFYVINPSQENRLFILKWIARIAPILVIYGLLLFVMGRSMFMRDHTGAMRFGGGTIPAYMAAASFASAVAYAMLYRYEQKFKYIVLVFICLICAILSGSRMPTVCTVIAVMPILFFSMKQMMSKSLFVFSALLSGAALMLTIGDQLLKRFESQSTSGRDKLWNSIIEWIDYYPFTGVGFGHHPLIIPEYVKRVTLTQAAHNEYIRVSAELGYIGAFLFLLGLLMIFNASFFKRSPTDYITAFLVCVAFGLFSYSDNTLLSTYCGLMPLAYAMGSGLKKEI